MKKELTVMPLFICFLAAVGFSQATKPDRSPATKPEPPSTQANPNTGPYVQLNPSGPQTITAGPLNIIASPNNPPTECTLCLSDETTPTHNGGVEFLMWSRSASPGNFPLHLVANYWTPPDGASVGDYIPLGFWTEGDGNATFGSYLGAQFYSGNGGGKSPIYVNWEGVDIYMVNDKQNSSGVTVPGNIYGLRVRMPGIVGEGLYGDVSAGVRVEGLPQATSLAFETPKGSIRTENGDIVTQSGTIVGQQFLLNGIAYWTAGVGEPPTQSCPGGWGMGSIYSRADPPDSNHALYVCTRQGWVAK
jgi:hypothetical protein